MKHHMSLAIDFLRLLACVLAGLAMLLPYFLADLLTHMQKPDVSVSTPEKAVEEEDKVTDLPEIPQLQHLAKNRPKRPKKHASSRNIIKVGFGQNLQESFYFTYFRSGQTGSRKISKMVWTTFSQRQPLVLPVTPHRWDRPWWRISRTPPRVQDPPCRGREKI